ncbi:outer membrane beta-barrel protein [Mesorhizobium sp. NBSH29]|uniref:outer membrane protein n=1 Tax=Mesorhizobium sp. NBSH29 TaxID=2654249 RepID=UPI0018965FF1|nr:outer membrane protein [Mesorhizobium sp. NBSH29]QPC85776.1 outer membrane beta-barrel protein [Mesorhizobium sp. NBSH29]
MKVFLRLVLPVALCAAAPVQAADYDPPIVVDQAPEYVPVEIGSGWYLRGDVGYSVNKPFRDASYAVEPIVYEDEKYSPISGTIGMGYHFNDVFRSELNVGILPGSKQSLGYLTPDSSVTLEAENEFWTGMVNAYADLGTVVGITPYIGGGVGFVYNKHMFTGSQNFADPAYVDIAFSDEARRYDFAYSLGAGVSYAVAKNLSVNLGYEYLSAPKARVAEITEAGNPVLKEGLDVHQIKLGLRYDLW